MIKPNAFMVGFPRSGSTYLANLLKQHPDINIPKQKEINYLNHKPISLKYTQYKSPERIYSFLWYCSLFKNKKIRMDCSIRAIYDEKAPERIYKKLGDIPIIIVIRKNKDNFLKSLFKVMKIQGDFKKDFEFIKFKKKFSKLIENYLNYEKQIERYKKIFSKVLVVNIIEKDTKKEIKKILKFLKIKKIKFNYDLPRNTQEKLSFANNFSYYKRKIFMGIPVLSPLLQKIVEIWKYKFKKKNSGLVQFDVWRSE
jgi:hypothetical protein